ncbi:hypothetical protein [Acuticoccus yangtzensis]|uniref:hypothetical protein n=1 Tax=Acuticoccus yangtzensis TaxID=1443441 RepID=UPI000A53F572|nr:hypothetical protein [Acuticoccus yangtzensis]
MAVGGTPVFVAAGGGVLGAVEALRLEPALTLVATPRAAQVLVVAGEQRPSDRIALARIHAQLFEPRATVWWRADRPSGFDFGTGAPESVSDAAAFISAQATQSEGEAILLDDGPPNPWEGVGPYGQGGNGMMGGTPYGRPMAMTTDDLRDGLALDAYSATFGPYLTQWPPGLIMETTLQGDVIQSVRIVEAPLAQDLLAATPHLELARLLRLLELPALADRLVRAALADPARAAAGLARAVRWTGLLAAIPSALARDESGGDVRSRTAGRLDALSAGRPADPAAPGDLAAMLIGLEWHEAALVLASFSIDELRGAIASPAVRMAKGAA